MAKYPATVIVHTVNGDEPCCKQHADKLVAVMRILGTSPSVSEIVGEVECRNCINKENKLRQAYQGTSEWKSLHHSCYF